MRPRLAPYAIAVFLAAVLVHAASLSGGFVYDDHRFIEKNPAIASLSNAPSYFTDPATASAAAGIEPDIYRPLRTLDFAIDRALFGLAPFGWHLASVLLHAINAVLVWLLLVRLLGAAAPAPPTRGEPSRAPLLAATLGGVLFAVHPVTVESVGWVSSRGDLLAWTLVLLALEALAERGRLRTAIGTALVFLACLAKESAVVAFLLLPLRDAAMPAATRLAWKTTLARTALLAAVTGVYFALRLSVLPGLAQTEFPEGSRAAAGRGMLAGLAWYARVLVAPFGFPFDRNVYTDPVPASWGDPAVILGSGIVLSILAAGLFAWRRGAGVVAFACFGSLVALLPVSNVIVPLKAFTAERFLYPAMPCIAAGAAVAILVAVRALSARRSRAWLAAGTAVLLLGLGILAVRREDPWKSETALWTAARAENPMNPRAYEGLGVEWMKKGNWNRAERLLTTYLEFVPWDGKAVVELADDMHGVSRDLLPGYAGAEQESNILRQRGLALKFEIRLRRKAMDTWAAYGLARARGSVGLRRWNLERWRDAALELTDLAETKRVNDLLIAEDMALHKGSVAPRELEWRLRLAMLALPAPPAPPDRQYDEKSRRVWEEERARARADILRDLKIDPNQSDREAGIALLPLVEPLLAARPDDVHLRRDRVEVVTVIVTNVDVDRAEPYLKIALADLNAIVARDPSDKYSRRQRDAVRDRLLRKKPQ